MVLEEGSIRVARGDSRDIRRIKETSAAARDAGFAVYSSFLPYTRRNFASFFCVFYYYHHREPQRFVPGSESSEIRGMRSSRCWVLGGKCGKKQRADEAENKMS